MKTKIYAFFSTIFATLYTVLMSYFLLYRIEIVKNFFLGVGFAFCIIVVWLMTLTFYFDEAKTK